MRSISAVSCDRTHYNYYRDLDPQTGRYIEPDPIGQRFLFGTLSSFGGVGRHRGYWNHLYNYVDNRPTMLRDRLGLASAWLEWLSELWNDKAPEEAIANSAGAGLAAVCITRNCGLTRSDSELTGDCLSLFNDWIKKQGKEVVAYINVVFADNGAGIVSSCSELCAKGITTSACCKGSKR